MKMKLKKGDKVVVTVGKDRGKEGAVEKVWLKSGRVSVGGVNIFKRHRKARGEGQKSGIIDMVRPLAVTSIALICPKCKKPTRIGYKVTSKDKVRVCKKCGEEI